MQQSSSSLNSELSNTPSIESHLKQKKSFPKTQLNTKYYQTRKTLSQESYKIEKMMRFAHVNRSQQVEVQEQAKRIFKKAKESNVAFVCVFGSWQDRAQLFMDFGNTDNQKQSDYEIYNSDKPVLRISKKPLILSNHTQLFFLQFCSAFDFSTKKQNCALMDIAIALSSAFFILNQNIYSYNQVINAYSRWSKHEQQIMRECWPFCLMYVKKWDQQGELAAKVEHLFEICDCLHYWKGNNIEKKQVVHKLKQNIYDKSVESMKYTGSSILLFMTLISNGQANSLSFKKVFKSMLTSQVEHLLKFHQHLYSQNLHNFFQDQKPYKLDYLINAFQKCQKQVLDNFDVACPEGEIKTSYREQLEDYIGQKQRLVLQVNKKKSKKLWKQVILQNGEDDISSFVDSVSNMNKEYDHHNADVLSQKLLKIAKKVENSEQYKTNHFQEKIKKLKKKITHKQAKLQSYKKQSKLEPQQSSLIQNKEDLDKKISTIRKQIIKNRDIYKEYLFNRKFKQDEIEQHLQNLRQLQEQERQNYNTIKQLKTDNQFNPEIDRMQKKIEEYERKVEEMSEKMDSYLNGRGPSKISKQEIQRLARKEREEEDQGCWSNRRKVNWIDD